MAVVRYELRAEENGTWAVLDIFTGWPAIEGRMTGLQRADADDALEILNLLDLVELDELATQDIAAAGTRRFG
jgi:hypothetical protein